MLAVIGAHGGPIIRIAPEQWPTLSSLLDEAFDLPPAAREHWLSQLTPAHLPLQPLLRDFLAKHAVVETDDFLETLPKFTAAGNDLRRTTPNGARLAIARDDPAAALAASSSAIDVFDNLTGPRDVRMGPKLWRIRAESLLLSGDAPGARQLAERALDANRRYDDSSSPDIAEAEATLSAAKAAITASVKQP